MSTKFKVLDNKTGVNLTPLYFKRREVNEFDALYLVNVLPQETSIVTYERSLERQRNG